MHVLPVDKPGAELALRRVAAIVLVADPHVRARPPTGLVAEMLGLTTAEAEIACLLAEAKTVPEIAERIHRTKDTVRWHLKRTYSKLGIRGQAELVRLVLSVSMLRTDRRLRQ
jgi:DNA-binding CsgD family transcriptional regulator